MSVERGGVSEGKFWEQAFSRNEFLIPKLVQERLKQTRIAVAGLSVGGNAARLLVETGAGKLTVADGGKLALSSLNRVHGRVADVGKNKAIVLARDMLETNPFLNLMTYPKNIGTKTDEKTVSYDEFLEGVEIVVDAVDSLPAKLGLRQAAKRRGIWVLMGTDLGFTAKIDVEKKTIFHGRLTEEELEMLKNPELDLETKTMLAVKIVGPEFIPSFYLKALKEAGENQAGFWPQLGMTAKLTAVLIVKAVLEILEGKEPAAEMRVDLNELI